MLLKTRDKKLGYTEYTPS